MGSFCLLDESEAGSVGPSSAKGSTAWDTFPLSCGWRGRRWMSPASLTSAFGGRLVLSEELWGVLVIKTAG